MTKTDNQATPVDHSTKLELLSRGLLMLDLQKEIDEPGYSTIGRMTFDHAVVKQRHSYCSELQRVLDELKLTAQLLNEVNEQKQTKDKVHEPEEIINYYSGVFFDQVHQIKDKLLRLVDYICADGHLVKPYDEPKEVKVSKLLTKHGAVIDKVGIRGLLEAWQQGDNTFGIILRKRTEHHHRVSRLHLDSDFQRIRMSKIALSPNSQATLNEYGKKRMTELGIQSYEKLKSETVAKQQKSIDEIVNNLNSIAEKLIDYYKIPTKPKEIAKITVDYIKHLSSHDIKNETSLDKIPPEVKKMTDSLLKMIEKLGNQSVSVYLVGSCGRGEFIPGVSDINIYVITKSYSQSFDTELPITLSVLSEKDFLSDKHKKDRFICWSDGVLLAGKQFEFSSKDFPKPGTLLSLLLNRDIFEKLQELKEEITALKSPSNLQLRLYGIKIARMMMDFGFGVAIANKPYYTASREKKIAYTKEVFPNETRTVILEQIYKTGIVSQDDFSVLIDVFSASARKTYDKLIEIEKELI